MINYSYRDYRYGYISINNHSYRGFIMLYPNISRLLGVHHSYINPAQPGEQLE